MRCPVPNCVSTTRVLETRARVGNVTYRRYECKTNHHRFITEEQYERLADVQPPGCSPEPSIKPLDTEPIMAAQ